MPLAMVVGVALCRPLDVVERVTEHTLTPVLIAAMLFITFCRVDIRQMRLSWSHLWMLLIQFVGAAVVYYAVTPLLGETVGQGAMICVMAPIAIYLWLISLILVMGRTTLFILNADADPMMEVELALVALVLCFVQFKAGRFLGRYTGDVVATTQSVGQKNTIFAIWLSLNFLNPIASIAPTAYIVWQNFANSWQMWKHERRAK